MSNNKSGLRKCSFYINPDYNKGDKIASELLDEIPLKERGRAMRAMLVTGAALMKQDKRLPNIIADYVTNETTIFDILRLIRNVLPIIEDHVDEKLISALNKILSSNPKFTNKLDSFEEKDSDINKTRENSNKLFPDDDY